MKIVINDCYGGFSLSPEGEKAYLARKGEQADPNFYSRDLERNDPDLVAIVEADTAKVSGAYAKLKVVEIPDDVEWTVQEYDGMEWVAEKHRTWG